MIGTVYAVNFTVTAEDPTDLPSAGDFVMAIAEVLPKEWWSPSEGDFTLRVIDVGNIPGGIASDN
jgi:hypothetical protein